MTNKESLLADLRKLADKASRSGARPLATILRITVVAYQANEEQILSGIMKDYFEGLEQSMQQGVTADSKAELIPKRSLRSQ